VDSEHTESPTPRPSGNDDDTLAVTGGQPPYALLVVGVMMLVLGLIARRRSATRG
jgi:LPXTG-motif cell wall-anchored protein